MASSFQGWSDAAFDFYEQLEQDNSKAFWDARKSVYEQQVKGPFLALSDAVADEFGPLKVFRPNRDVRFSKDKTPYKTACYAVGEGEGGERYYLGLSTRGLTIGSGFWMMANDQLDRFRVAIVDDKIGPVLSSAVTVVRSDGLEIEGQPLKTAPRGYDRDHPRIELLRCKSMAAMQTQAPGTKWVGKPAALDHIVATWRAARPVNDWLARHVGPSTEPPREFTRN